MHVTAPIRRIEANLIAIFAMIGTRKAEEKTPVEKPLFKDGHDANLPEKPWPFWWKPVGSAVIAVAGIATAEAIIRAWMNANEARRRDSDKGRPSAAPDIEAEKGPVSPQPTERVSFWGRLFSRRLAEAP
jgi:hypothetical protein